MGTDMIQVEWIEEERQEADGRIMKEEAAADAEYVKKNTRTGDTAGMQEFGFLREGGRCYLTCPSESGCGDEEMMLADNKPDGFLIVTLRSMNGQAKLLFDITGKQSLLRCYEKKKMSYEELIALLLSVKSGLDRVGEYLLSEDGLVLSPAYLYRNMSGKQFYFAYLPSSTGVFAQQIRELARFLMDHVDYGEDAAVELAGQFFQYTEAENFNMTVFMEENRSYFERSGMEKDQEEQAGEELEAGVLKPDETGSVEEGEGQPLKEKKPVRTGAAIAAGALLAAWVLPKMAWVLIPGGMCAGTAAGILPYWKGRAKQKLLKKEREIYLFSEEQV